MNCEVWYCVTNETLTLIAVAEGMIIAALGVWVFVLDGIVSRQDVELQKIRDRYSLKRQVAARASMDQRVREAQAQEKYGIDYGE